MDEEGKEYKRRLELHLINEECLQEEIFELKHVIRSLRKEVSRARNQVRSLTPPPGKTTAGKMNFRRGGKKVHLRPVPKPEAE